MYAFSTMSGINYCSALLIGWVDSPDAFLEDMLYPGIFWDSVQGILVTIEVRLNAPIIPAFSETLNNTIAIASSLVLLTRGDKSLAVCPGSASCC